MGLKPQAQGGTKHSRPGSLVSSELFCTLHSVPADRARLGARALGLDAKRTPSTHSHVLAHEHMCTGTLSDTHTRSKLGAQMLTPREHSQLLKHRSSTSTRHTHTGVHTHASGTPDTHMDPQRKAHIQPHPCSLLLADTHTLGQPHLCCHTHTQPKPLNTHMHSQTQSEPLCRK